MDNRLQELTDKIYQEGVTKGNEEATKIVAEAKNEASNTISEAEKKAEKIIAEAEKKAAELKENTLSELRLASNQSLDALKQEIINLVTGSITQADIKAAMGNVEFVQTIIKDAIDSWASNKDGELDMNILVPKANAEKIDSYFASASKDVLEKGLKIESVNGLKAGFQVTPKDGSFKISFTDDDFVNFFKEYIRPKVAELLFSK